MRPALSLVAILLLAGCVAQQPSGVVDAPPTDALQAITNVTREGVLHGINGSALPVGVTLPHAVGGGFHVGGNTGEPTLGVDKKGNVYVAGMEPSTVPGAPDGGGTVFMSSDKGQTWKNVGPRVPGANQPVHAVSFDPYLYVDQDTGRVFSDDIWPLGCGMLSYSDDQAQTWTNNPASCGNPQVNDHQTIVAAKPRLLVPQLYSKIVYRCVNNVGDAACATSVDGGLTFGPQIVALPGAENGGGDTPQPQVCGGLTGHLGAAPDGTVYLPRGGCGWAEVAVTQDDGVTWTQRTIDRQHPPDDHEVRVAVDEENVVYAMWNSKGHEWFSFSKDAGAKWSAPIDVTAPGVTGTAFNAVAAGAPGKIALAYIGTTIPGGYEGKKSASDWKGATWNAYLTVIVNATSDSPVMQSVTVNDPSDPIARDQCGRTRCNGMYDFIDVWLDQDGRPWASFVDVCTKKCVTDNATAHDVADGLVGSLLTGPALRGANDTLTAILPQAPRG